MSESGTRARRNNNPGNIERGNSRWQGLMPKAEMTVAQQDEPRFAVFRTPAWGFRALAVTLITYQDKRRAADGSPVDTVAEVIARWAPLSENNTVAYVADVCRRTGFGPNQQLDLHKYDNLFPLCKAIAIHESGGWLFRDAELEQGLQLAGVTQAVMPKASKRPLQAGSVALGAEGIRESLAQVQDQLAVVGPSLKIVGVLLALVSIASLGLALWQIWRGWAQQRGGAGG